MSPSVQLRDPLEVDGGNATAAHRRLRPRRACVMGLVILALTCGAIAVWQRGQARDAALVAEAQRLAAEALTRGRLDEALLLARAGVALHPSTQTHGSLLSALLRQPALVGEIRNGWPLHAAAISPDSTMIAIGDANGGLTVYDTATRQQVGEPVQVPAGRIQSMAFAPGGRTLALATHARSTLIDLIDPETGAHIRRVALPRFRSSAAFRPTVVFHPNGRDLIVQQADPRHPRRRGSVLSHVNGQTGEALRASRPIGRSSSSTVVATADGQRLFVTSPGEGMTHAIDAVDLRVRRTYPVGASAAAVTPDGNALALASIDGTVRLVDLSSGRVTTFRGRHDGAESIQVAIAPDGRTVVSAAGAGEIIVWDVSAQRIRERLVEHSGTVRSLIISADSRLLYSAAVDGRLLTWDLAGERRLERPFDAGPPLQTPGRLPKGITTSPDGDTIAVTQADGSVDLIDTARLERRNRLGGSARAALAADFSPDGRLLAVTGVGGAITIWDVAARRRIRVIDMAGGVEASTSIAFSADGELIATAEQSDHALTASGNVRLWNVATGEAVLLDFPLASPAIALSPDGQLAAAAGVGVPSEVRDIATGEVVAALDTGDAASTVAFSPDGQLLALGDVSGNAVLLSTRTYEQVGPRLAGHRARLTALEFSPDGRRLLTGSGDGTVRLWDVAAREPIGSPLLTTPNRAVAATFTADGSYVVAVPQSGAGVRWDVREASWERHACRVAGRSLTESEWQVEVPGRAYREVCAAP